MRDRLAFSRPAPHFCTVDLLVFGYAAKYALAGMIFVRMRLICNRRYSFTGGKQRIELAQCGLFHYTCGMQILSRIMHHI